MKGRHFIAMLLALVLTGTAAFAQTGTGIMTGRVVRADTITARDMTISVEEDVIFTQGSDGFYYLYPYYEGIPYVMFGSYQFPEEDFYEAFTEMMESSYEDLQVLVEPVSLVLEGREWKAFRYAYGVSGFTVIDTRLYTAREDMVYLFGSKEVPELGYTLGTLLFEVAASLKLEGEEAPVPAGQDTGEKTPEAEGGLVVGKTDSSAQIGAVGGSTGGSFIDAAGFFGSSTEPPATPGKSSGSGKTRDSILKTAAMAEPAPMSYKPTTIVDSDTKMPMGRIYAPSDYQVAATSSWFFSGISTPVSVEYDAFSLAGDVFFGYVSGVTYEDDEAWFNGQLIRDEEGTYNPSNMSYTYRYREAGDFCDFYKDRLLQGNVDAILLEDAPVSAEEQANLNQMTKQIRDAQEKSLREIGSDLKVEDAAVTEGCRLYSLTLQDPATGKTVPYYMVIQAIVQMIQTSSSFVYGDGGNHSDYEIFGFPMQTSGFSTRMVYRSWGPMSLYFALIPQERMNEIYPVYLEFMKNTGVSDQFYLYRNTLSSSLYLAMLRETSSIDYADIAVDTAKNYKDEPSTYTDEEAFSDYIFDNNDYVTSSGDHVKVSTSYDYVYEDEQGNIWGTNSAETPAGMTQLTPSQIGH